MVTQPAESKKGQVFPKNVCRKVHVKLPLIGLEETKLKKQFPVRKLLASKLIFLEKQNSLITPLVVSP